MTNPNLPIPIPTALPQVAKGTCYLLFAFDIGASIDLDKVSMTVKETAERTKLVRNRRTPSYFDYDPPPVQILHHGQQLNAGRFFSKPQSEITLFDFGGCSVRYQIDFAGPLEQLIELSEVLYDNLFFLEDARSRVIQVSSRLIDAVSRPKVLATVEDFAVFHLESFESEIDCNALLVHHPKPFARILRAESDDLGDEEIHDALTSHASYRTNDLAVIDWNAALFFGKGVDDVVAVLEFCNVELLEMRVLDEQLDDSLETAYQILITNTKAGGNLRQIARLQVESAILYEAVENALKLLGDQYLARLYSLATQRFHLPEWDAGILRKLNTLDSIYQKLSDQAAKRRSEALEWIVILLILIEVIFGFWNSSH